MQIELLRELMKLQKDMIIMLLSMLEGRTAMPPLLCSTFLFRQRAERSEYVVVSRVRRSSISFFALF